jgi:hypothetical protein
MEKWGDPVQEERSMLIFYLPSLLMQADSSVIVLYKPPHFVSAGLLGCSGEC